MHFNLLVRFELFELLNAGGIGGIEFDRFAVVLDGEILVAMTQIGLTEAVINVPGLSRMRCTRDGRNI